MYVVFFNQIYDFLFCCGFNFYIRFLIIISCYFIFVGSLYDDWCEDESFIFLMFFSDFIICVSNLNGIKKEEYMEWNIQNIVIVVLHHYFQKKNMFFCRFNSMKWISLNQNRTMCLCVFFFYLKLNSKSFSLAHKHLMKYEW